MKIGGGELSNELTAFMCNCVIWMHLPFFPISSLFYSISIFKLLFIIYIPYYIYLLILCIMYIFFIVWSVAHQLLSTCRVCDSAWNGHCQVVKSVQFPGSSHFAFGYRCAKKKDDAIEGTSLICMFNLPREKETFISSHLTSTYSVEIEWKNKILHRLQMV